MAVAMKVFGIQQAGKNIREDLMAVLQKKLDDKVVEVISMMLQRNSRCKLSTEDVLFLQRPGLPADYTLQFAVHPATIQYMQAVAFYLRQNMVTPPDPLITPNYTSTTTTRFKDQEEGNCENDVFIYNNFNSRGGHKGLACISLAIVASSGGLVRHSTYPKPAVVQGVGLGLHELEEMLQTEVFRGEGAVPEALVAFRVWEQGRVDIDAITKLLQCSIKHALWDAILEYRMLPAPVAERREGEEQEQEQEQELATPLQDSPQSKLDLGGLQAAAFSLLSSSPEMARKPSLPEIGRAHV